MSTIIGQPNKVATDHDFVIPTSTCCWVFNVNTSRCKYESLRSRIVRQWPPQDRSRARISRAPSCFPISTPNSARRICTGTLLPCTFRLSICPLTRSPPLMRVALLIAACLAALCPPASGQTVFSRPYEPNQIALEAFVPELPNDDASGRSGTKASSAI